MTSPRTTAALARLADATGIHGDTARMIEGAARVVEAAKALHIADLEVRKRQHMSSKDLLREQSRPRYRPYPVLVAEKGYAADDVSNVFYALAEKGESDADHDSR